MTRSKVVCSSLDEALLRTIESEIDSINSNHHQFQELWKEKEKLEDLMNSDFFIILDTIINRLNFNDVKKTSQSEGKEENSQKKEISRNIEMVESLKMIIQDIESETEFKSRTNLRKALTENIHLAAESDVTSNLLPESVCFEKYYNSNNELHKLLLVDTHRAEQLSGNTKGEPKLLLFDQTFPNFDFSAKSLLSLSKSDLIFEYPADSKVSFELPSLRAHELCQMNIIPGNQILIVYKPEIRSKPLGLAVINFNQEVSFAMAYYPLTSSPKDSFEGQFIKLDSSRSCVAIRESSTSLRVSSIVKNWAFSDESIRQSGSLIKVEDFIKDFCVETVGDNLVFASILLRNNKIKSYLIESDKKKHTLIQPYFKNSHGQKEQKENSIVTDPLGLTNLGMEAVLISPQSKEVALFLMGYSPREHKQQDHGHHYIPSVKGYVFNLEFNDLPQSLEKGSLVTLVQLSKHDVKNFNTEKHSEEFEPKEIMNLGLKRSKMTSSLMAFEDKDGSRYKFVGSVAVPSKSQALLFTWKLAKDLSKFEDFYFVITTEGSLAEGAYIGVSSLYFEHTRTSRTPGIGVSNMFSAFKAKSLKIKIQAPIKKLLVSKSN